MVPKDKETERGYTVMIVDDEPDARELLGTLVSEHQDIRVVATASGASEALPLITRIRPDLLFLDIQMPAKNGFELVSELRSLEITTPVIFVTAYDEFAIQAIKASALDYLMKPVDPFELAKAIQRFRNQELKERYQQKLEALLNAVHPSIQSGAKLRFNNRSGYILIHPDDILYLEADANYTHIYLREHHKETISNNLGLVEKSLPVNTFQRISRSLIINTTWLQRVDRINHQCFLNCEGIEICLKATLLP